MVVFRHPQVALKVEGAIVMARQNITDRLGVSNTTGEISYVFALVFVNADNQSLSHGQGERVDFVG